MKIRFIRASSLVLLALGALLSPAYAGDSIYGKVTEVRSADVVVLDYGAGRYIVHIVGIEVPKEGRTATAAKQFVTKLLLGKNARMFLQARKESGEIEARLQTDDPEIGLKDVGRELIKFGLVRRQQGEDTQFGYKYRELSTAEREAQDAKRGVWAAAQ